MLHTFRTACLIDYSIIVTANHLLRSLLVPRKAIPRVMAAHRLRHRAMLKMLTWLHKSIRVRPPRLRGIVQGRKVNPCHPLRPPLISPCTVAPPQATPRLMAAHRLCHRAMLKMLTWRHKAIRERLHLLRGLVQGPSVNS